MIHVCYGWRIGRRGSHATNRIFKGSALRPGLFAFEGLMKALNELRGHANTALDWARFLIGLTLWIVLGLFVAKAVGAPVPTPDGSLVAFWIYAAGFYWLIK